jgi:hypothetical protein
MPEQISFSHVECVCRPMDALLMCAWWACDGIPSAIFASKIAQIDTTWFSHMVLSVGVQRELQVIFFRILLPDLEIISVN